MRTILGSVLVLVSACGFEPLGGETTALPVTVERAAACQGAGCMLSARGVVENGLAYDGCSFPLTLGGTTYAPSAASKAKVEAVAKTFGRTNVTVTYSLTGAQADVECGWSSKQTLPEIDVVSIAEVAVSPP
ncbi:MAG: hypothetical protein SFW67_30370 [Myxococcaceae bacterium]|nr:hypothetical protein [Myxococcaceae bacterium]